MSAAWEGHIKVVRVLLDKGADVNAKTNGSITDVPTHQVALCVGDKIDIAATEMAAGLNKWRFSTVKRYFAAIATADAPTINIKFKGNFTGIIKAKIRAVIKTDSTFVETPKIFAKT